MSAFAYCRLVHGVREATTFPMTDREDRVSARDRYP